MDELMEMIMAMAAAIAAQGGFDPYKQPGMGMGHGQAFGAGAASRAAGMDPLAGTEGYRGPARGLPRLPPGPGQMMPGGQPPMLGGPGYGMAQGAQLPGLGQMMQQTTMRRGGR